MIARVLIDNGSSLNVMPKATLDKLYCLGTTLKNSPVVVRAFDRSKREVMGEITLPICIGPTIFDITFQVMDIRPAYSCLLDQKLISVMGEKELMISMPLPAEYVKGDEKALETSFQALEIVETTSSELERGSPKFLKATIMAKKVLIGHNYQPGKGLGKGSEGIVKPENPGRSKLCHTKATKGGSRRKIQQIQPDLYRYFISGGIISLDQIAVIEGQPLVQAEWVKPMKGTLTNWTIEALPKLVSRKMKDEEEGPEEEALVELERLLEQEGPKLQSRAKELEIINLGKEGETREIKVDIFAWSYRDMPDLDTIIMVHKLPLLLDPVPVRQPLRRMKLEVTLKIKEEVEN
ncbi:hypothetical protein CR513_24782, partial [Mucuna pruriens]